MTHSNWIRVSRRTASLVTVLLAFALAACDGGPTGTNESSLSVQLTDGEGTVEAVWIDVTELRVVGQSGDGGGRITLLSDAGDDDPANDDASDLVRLSAESVETLVSEAVLPSGTYGQIRLVVGGAVLETEDGQVYTRDGAQHPDGLASNGELTCPSCDQTGIKIVPPGGALRLDAESKVLVLDFDVHQSFEAGASGQWTMSPVILATELELSGNIVGQVDAGDVSLPVACGGQDRTVEDFIPQAESETNGDLKTGTVDPDGSYEIRFLQAGEWSMTFDDRVAFNGDTLVFTLAEGSPDPAAATVQEGQNTSVSYTLGSVSCASGSGG